MKCGIRVDRGGTGEPGLGWQGRRRLEALDARLSRLAGGGSGRLATARRWRNFPLKSAVGILTIRTVSEDLPFSTDYLFAQRCLEGGESAISGFQAQYRPIVIAYLRQTGASENESTEVADSLWTDLLEERADYRPRLATYAGRASLKSWLRPFALNRLIARKRAEK